MFFFFDKRICQGGRQTSMRERAKLRSSLNTGKCLTYLILDGKQNSRGFLAEDRQTCGSRGVPWNVKSCSRKICVWSTHLGKYALGLQKVYRCLQGDTCIRVLDTFVYTAKLRAQGNQKYFTNLVKQKTFLYLFVHHRTLEFQVTQFGKRWCTAMLLNRHASSENGQTRPH